MREGEIVFNLLMLFYCNIEMLAHSFMVAYYKTQQWCLFTAFSLMINSAILSMKIGVHSDGIVEMQN